MVKRHFWLEQIDSAWKKKSLIWLTGVRRVGKTYLCQSLPDIEYFDCERPRLRRQMEDPESFLEKLQHKKIVLDEVHRLANPTELLKIATDHFPTLKIIATGSSTLQASFRFRDTLTGRKALLWLTPMNAEDLVDFGKQDLTHRFSRGGLPPFFLSDGYPEADYQEWIDSFWAKDVQELFRLEKQYSFKKFLELIFLQSGGVFEATRFSGPCEASRITISNYLSVLEATWVVQVIRPFSTRKSVEIVSAPKIYAFDTGFICHFRGWDTLREEDLGLLWEHWVLNEFFSHRQSTAMNYWRDKQGHEVDFIWTRPGKPPIAIECKWKADHFEARNMKTFRRHYPDGPNWVVCQDVREAFSKRMSGITVEFLGLDSFRENILRAPGLSLRGVKRRSNPQESTI
jgi:hypothetical protein